MEKSKRKPKGSRVPDIEDKYLAKIGKVSDTISSLVSALEEELCTALKTNQKELPSKCKEFQELDIAHGRFNDALVSFQMAIDKRRVLE